MHFGCHTGFAYKRAFDAFVDFFWPLCPSALHDLQRYHKQHQQQQQGSVASGSSTEGAIAASRAAAERILQAANVPEYQLGCTKVRGACYRGSSHLSHVPAAERILQAANVPAYQVVCTKG